MKLSHILAAAAFSLPVTALAEYSYSYLEIGYRAGELSKDDGSGFDAEVNFLLGDVLYASFNIDEVEYDNDLHLDRFGIGLGAHFNAFWNIDLYGVISYEDIEFDIPAANDFDDKGWGYEIGARYALNDDWEFRIAGDFAKYKKDSVDLESRHAVLTAVYHISSNYDLIGEYNGGELIFNTPNIDSEESTLKVGLRFQF